MKSSRQDRAEGHGKHAKGKLKEGAGRMTNDRELEAEGRTDQAEGKIQKKSADIKRVFNQ